MVAICSWQQSARFVRLAFPLRLSRPGPEVAAAAKPRWTALAGAAKSILWAGISRAVGPSRKRTGDARMRQARMNSNRRETITAVTVGFKCEGTAMTFDRTAGDHRFAFRSEVCVLCGISRAEFEDEGQPRCEGQAPPDMWERPALAPENDPPAAA
jgi:hypothetical protein